MKYQRDIGFTPASCAASVPRLRRRRRREPGAPWHGSAVLIVALSFICAAATPSGGWAQALVPESTSALKRMSVEQLLNIEVVSVTRSPEPLGQAPSSLFLIRGESARASGATTLPELLRLAPNFFVARMNSSEWAVSSRGFTRTDGRSNKLLVMIDGRTVYSPLFSGVFWDTQSVFLPDLDRIEAISGPGGSAWGSNAVNGVINITTRHARESQGGVIYAGLGDRVENNVGARYGGTFGQDAYYRVYAKRTSFDSTLSSDGAERGDRWQFAQTGFRADWGDATSGAFTLQGDAYSGRYGVPVGTRIRNDGANLIARWERQFSDDSKFVVRAYHDYTLREVPGDIAERLHTSDLEVQHSRRIGGHALTMGANYRYMDDSVRNPPAGYAILPDDLNLRLAGIFVEDSMSLASDALRLTAGLRLEHNDYTDWEYQPNVRLAWTPVRGHTVWGAVSRSTRTPSRIDTDFFIPGFVAGGPDFKSEVLHAYELGWRGLPREGVSATLTLYYHDYDDLRSLEPTSPIVIANGVAGRSYGVEMFLDWEINKWWRLRLGGHRLVAHTRLEPGSGDLERGLGEVSDPGFVVQLRSGFQITRDLRVWAALRRVDEVPAYQTGAYAPVPAYTELDARVGWMVQPGVELSISGRNLLHSSHPEIGTPSTWSEIRRGVQAMVQWEF